eukprot:14073189-Ditylum_brightwellii.AAC.1
MVQHIPQVELNTDATKKKIKEFNKKVNARLDDSNFMIANPPENNFYTADIDSGSNDQDVHAIEEPHID